MTEPAASSKKRTRKEKRSKKEQNRRKKQGNRVPGRERGHEEIRREIGGEGLHDWKLVGLAVKHRSPNALPLNISGTGAPRDHAAFWILVYVSTRAASDIRECDCGTTARHIFRKANPKALNPESKH